MNGRIARQSLCDCIISYRAAGYGCSQGRCQPARSAPRTLDGEPERRLSLCSTSDALLKPDNGTPHLCKKKSQVGKLHRSHSLPTNGLSHRLLVQKESLTADQLI